MACSTLQVPGLWDKSLKLDTIANTQNPRFRVLTSKFHPKPLWSFDQIVGGNWQSWMSTAYLTATEYMEGMEGEGQGEGLLNKMKPRRVVGRRMSQDWSLASVRSGQWVSKEWKLPSFMHWEALADDRAGAIECDGQGQRFGIEGIGKCSLDLP